MKAERLFSLTDNWQKVNSDPVCFGAKNDNYGTFSITNSGLVKTMKLVHKLGSIRCNTVYGDSYWSCDNPNYYSKKLTTIITNVKRAALLPVNGDLKKRNNCVGKHFYSLEGAGHKSPELVFRNLSSPLSLSRNQELQIWYGQDWVDCGESDNSGAVCVDVYTWYI